MDGFQVRSRSMPEGEVEARAATGRAGGDHGPVARVAAGVAVMRMRRAVAGRARVAAVAAAGLALGDPVADGVATAVITTDHVVGVDRTSARTVTDDAAVTA